MQNPTHDHDQQNRPEHAIDFGAIVDITDDQIKVTRPSWLSIDRWEQVKMLLEDGLDDVVEHVTGRCATYAWCTMRPEDPEHHDHHCGDMVDLAGGNGATAAPGEPLIGWYAYPVAYRDQLATIRIEGDAVDGHASSWTVEMGALHDVLAATATPEAREALQGLVDRMIRES